MKGLHEGLVRVGGARCDPFDAYVSPSSLEAIKLCHDFYSTMSIESLAIIRKRYSISAEYVLHALAPRQRPYHTCPEGFSISIDALEVGLRFPLHPVIGECLG
ncbi:hypothetical protein B296_00032326 [Ensete ventricosum]|uniref:Uncharacterized protein n=1 Tax=Ensete ventricosum TaxID=4639 RepID=A0A426YUR9_ENSVE|nr:hypothetical protein B296_00032326 [Ensete ventricosum]